MRQFAVKAYEFAVVLGGKLVYLYCDSYIVGNMVNECNNMQIVSFYYLP